MKYKMRLKDDTGIGVGSATRAYRVHVSAK